MLRRTRGTTSRGRQCCVLTTKMRRKCRLTTSSKARHLLLTGQNKLCALPFFSMSKHSQSLTSGFRYGSDIVPFSKVDQEQMKYKHDGKCFAVLGFTKRSLVRDFSLQWLFHHLTHWFNKPKALSYDNLFPTSFPKGATASVHGNASRQNICCQGWRGETSWFVVGRDDELPLTSGLIVSRSSSVGAACWRGAVRPHPGAGSSWHGGHCALRLRQALQPASRSSFSVRQATLWSEIARTHCCFYHVSLRGQSWCTLLRTLALNSVSSMFSCHSWKTSDTSRFLLWKTTKSLRHQVPSPVSLWLH